MIRAYYNEHDRFAAAWLRSLIGSGLIPNGEVDERSIVDVRAGELGGFTQCHFFAGIGGWALALRLAGWPGSRPVWTGSCPCQPYSAAGKGTKQSDERHLWPTWYRLIGERRPPTIFGEQVDEAIAAGWLDDAFHDLEGSSYSCAAAVLPACSVLSTTERGRLFFCADTQRDGVQGRETSPTDRERERESVQQLSGLLQPHSWPTLSDSKLWISTHGIPASVGVSKANKCIGNAIVPQLAAEFIQAYCEARGLMLSSPATISTQLADESDVARKEEWV